MLGCGLFNCTNIRYNDNYVVEFIILPLEHEFGQNDCINRRLFQIFR